MPASRVVPAASTLVVSLLLALVAGASVSAAQARPVVVNLSAQNNSGLSGTATLTDLGGGKTRVELRLSGPEGNYPAHVHMGSCANLDPAPQYPLANVVGGTSTTEINASLASIQQSPHAINLHKSAQELATYVACGDIAQAAASTQSAASATVTLTAQNNSGLSGTATLTDLGGGKTRVEVRLSGPEGNYPAHVHMGTCANLDPAPQYPLANVVGGTSTTDITASLASLQQSQHAINLHKSAQELATYVACGDIAVARATASTAATAPAQAGLPVLRARDGKSLATESFATQAMFIAVWGDRAAARWVEEHEAALSRAGR